MAESADRPNRAGRLLNAAVETYDLEKEIQFIQSEPEYREKGHNALTLTKSDTLRNVLICLQKDARLHEHNAPGAFTLYVLRGEIQFSLNSSPESAGFELKQGQLLVLNEPQKHAVVAREDSAFLLTIDVPPKEDA